MERIRGLEEYVKNKEYREALGLPKEKTENYELLAQGEYNINYAFTHPVTGKKLLLRVNCGSQMHLEHQIEYEAHALRLMEGSGRTPKVLYVDGSKKILEHGVLVMEYLPGHAMDYHTELMLAAPCLADIHSVPIPESEEILIHPQNPLKAILEECEEMFKVYLESPLGDGEKKTYIREPGETVRMLPYLKEHGQVVVSTHAIKPVTATLSGSSYDAPPMIDYLKKHVENLTLIDADTICRQIGSQKVLNMVLLGAAIRTGVLDFSLEEIEEVMKKTLPEKFHEMNLKALRYA